jgi:hypothetical protein
MKAIRLGPVAVAALILGLVATSLAACGAGAAPPPTPRPTPTPIVVHVATPEEAAALVIASDPRFAGTIKLSPDIIGASRWWEAAALADGGFQIMLTIGWGDCPSGCIDRHSWVYRVTADGLVTLESETGDPMPAGSLPAG